MTEEVGLPCVFPILWLFAVCCSSGPRHRWKKINWHSFRFIIRGWKIFYLENWLDFHQDPDLSQSYNTNIKAKSLQKELEGGKKQYLTVYLEWGGKLRIQHNSRSPRRKQKVHFTANPRTPTWNMDWLRQVILTHQARSSQYAASGSPMSRWSLQNWFANKCKCFWEHFIIILGG